MWRKIEYVDSNPGEEGKPDATHYEGNRNIKEKLRRQSGGGKEKWRKRLKMFDEVKNGWQKSKMGPGTGAAWDKSV